MSLPRISTPAPVKRRPRLLAVLLTVAVMGGALWPVHAPGAEAAEPCASGANAVVCENSKPGADPNEWDISGSGDPTIQGYSSEISANVGSSIDLKVKTDAVAYTIDIYRTGWYQGLGARKVATVVPSATLPQQQPDCVSDSTTNLYDCGTWGVSATWSIPADAVSGVYVALLTRADTGGRSHITFVVRNEASHASVLFQTSDTTWQAYNNYGGSNFYPGGANGRAVKVSYNRPFNTRAGSTARDFYFGSEYPLVRFLEKNGYDVTYYSGVDTDRLGAGLLNHKVFLSVGHDEYWSAQQRANVAAARDAGVNLQFLSGNEMYWHTRFEPSVDVSAASYRTLVCYKETWANAKIDPQAEWTGTWRDPRFASPAEGAGQPENNLTGTLYASNASDLPVTVSSEEGKLRLWRDTGLANMPAGSSQALAPHTVGYESNEDEDNGFRPAGLIRMSTTTGPVSESLLDFGNTVGPGKTTHHLTLYRAPSGALVFSAGSVQWTWGLDQQHDGNGAPADVRMQQAQVNLLADMGAQAVTLDPGLVQATASSDTTPPVTTITSPTEGASVANGATVAVTGTASDVGGVVAGVEVSTDSGMSWHAATGTTDWSYSYAQSGFGSQAVWVRAVDDSANHSGTATTVGVSVGGPFTVFGSTVPTLVDAGDTSSNELGLRFSPAIDGEISGVRFYKSDLNVGVHFGSLWNSDGGILASATFTNETASGWQTVTFSAPVPVAAGKTYVVSYSSANGHYSADTYHWAYRADTAGPLLISGGFGAAPAGVYSSRGSFPTNSYHGANYYVDAIFSNVVTTAPTPTPTPVLGASLLGEEVPAVDAVAGEFSPVELGMAFTSSVAGSVTGIRFYKGSGNNGTHVGNLWSSSGVNLATVTFTGETASGWQSAALATPVVLKAGETYTVSYLAPRSGYSYTSGYFRTVKTSGPLTAVSTTNGRFRYGASGGFPTASYNATNYFVDVTFVVDSAATPTSTPTSTPTPTPPPTPTPTPAVGASLLGAEAPAVDSAAGEFSPVELGMAFTSSVAGSVTGIRFYKGSGNNGTHVGNLWSSSGVNLATVTFTGETASGWQSAALATPVVLAPGETYTVSYLAPQGGYSYTSGYFRTAVTSGSLTALPTTNGRFRYGNSGGFPTASFNAANYFVDVTFAVDSTATPTPVPIPTPTPVPVPDVGASVLGVEVPAVDTAAGESSPVELGMAFTSSAAGSVTGIRFYKGAGNGGTHVGNLWSSSGVNLASVTFTGESASGWQYAVLATPVVLTAGETYTVSYFAPQGGYSYTPGYFQAAKSSGTLTTVADTNGRFRYGASGGFPTSSFNATNYFVDVTFVAGSAPTP